MEESVLCICGNCAHVRVGGARSVVHCGRHGRPVRLDAHACQEYERNAVFVALWRIVDGDLPAEGAMLEDGVAEVSVR